MKFSELSKTAQAIAVNDYIKGWFETHPNDMISLQDAYKSCFDSEEDINYNEEGEIKG